MIPIFKLLFRSNHSTNWLKRTSPAWKWTFCVVH